MYTKPQIKCHSIYDVQQYEALAGSAGCEKNSGTSCGTYTQTTICICVAFCFKKA